MARQTINIGAAANDGTGDGIRTGGDKINDNFEELYGYTRENRFKFVRTKADFGTVVGGAITLDSFAIYYVIDDVDLTGDRLILGQNTCILGGSSENSAIISTGLGASTALITAIGAFGSFPMRNITIANVGTGIDINGDDTNALDWTGVNFESVTTIGTIQNIDNFVFTKGAFLSSQGLTIDNDCATVSFNESIFIGDGSAADIFTIAATANISRRFRIIYSSFVCFGSTVGIDFNSLATVPNDAYILDTVNFSGGGTYLNGEGAGIPLIPSNAALFKNCVGIVNTATVGSYYMIGNATSTTISTVNTPVKVSGTTTISLITQKFTHTSNRLTYDGNITSDFQISVQASMSGGNNKTMALFIAKNGTVIAESEIKTTTDGTGKSENIGVQCLTELSNGDYIELWVENQSDTTNVTIVDANLICKIL